MLTTKKTPVLEGGFEIPLEMTSLDLESGFKDACVPFSSIQNETLEESEDSSSARFDSSLANDIHRLSYSSPSVTSSNDSDALKVESHKSLFPVSLDESPETSTRLIHDQVEFAAQENYLLFLEPLPVSPPLYSTLPPGGAPKFHVMDKLSNNESLPSYSPAAYKIGVACRKLEWLSPYESSLNRSWRNVVVELNSTQLNIYQIPSVWEYSLLNFHEDTTVDNFVSPGHTEDERLMSLVTTNQDKQFRRLCDSLGFFKSHGSDPKCEELRSKLLNSKAMKSQGQTKLLRSYSLQHARMGLASDYTKKPNVLRLRVESEQFLLNFSTPKELIEWNLGLSVGRDVALDIEQREDPRYRTVPRRRRTAMSGSSFYFDVVSRRNRAQSDSFYDSKNRGMRNKLSKLKGKLSSQTSFSNLKGLSSTSKQTHENNLSKVKHTSPQPLANNSISPISVQLDLNRARAYSAVSFSVAAYEEDDDEIRDPHLSPAMSHLNQDNAYDDEGEDDIQNLSDLHQSDDEEDFELEIDELHDEMNPFRRRRKNTVNSASMDHKWRPYKKTESQRKFIRICLKCIKPLQFDESWVNRLLVKPASISPLSLVYIRNIYCTGQEKPSNSSVIANLPVGSVMDLTNLGHIGFSQKRCGVSKQNILSLPDVSLGRMANHNVKEYVVGSHSLIPKDI